MKLLLIILCSIIGLQKSNADINSEWKEFKLKFHREYNGSEDEYRKGIFMKTLKKVETHQNDYENGFVSYKIGINNFADMTNDEFDHKYGEGGNLLQAEFGRALYARNISVRALPTFVDWVKYGYNNPILNQGDCDSCYTFSAVAAVEGQYFIKHKKLIQLSQQELLDCTKEYGNNGCKGGGWQRNVYKYMLKYGVGYAINNPYLDNEGTCKRTGDRVKISNYYEIPYGDENALKQVVATIGPVPIDIDHSLETFRRYTGGIYYDENCRTNNPSHSMTVVGYGTTGTGEDFWLVRNSWGNWWGVNGYIYMARNKNNHCGVASRAVYPIVV